MPTPVKWRARARGALEIYFSRHSFPRFVLSAILATCGLVGFLISLGLLHAGVTAMGIRYFLAVFGAYLTGLGLVRLWVELERRRFDTERFREASDDPETWPLGPGGSPFERRHKGGGRSWLEWLDGAEVGIDDLEGCLAVIVAAVLLIAIVSVVSFVITSATSLLAEVFLDAFFVSAIYRRLRVAAVERWLGTALRRTWVDALWVAVGLSLLGLFLQSAAPGAHSIGPAVHELINPPPAR